MRLRTAGLVFTLLLMAETAGLTGQSATSSPQGYLKPPAAIVSVLDAEPLPIVIAASSGTDALALMSRRNMPSIEEVSQPMLRIAGIRLNPKNVGPHWAPCGTGITLRTIATGAERKIVAGKRAPWDRQLFARRQALRLHEHARDPNRSLHRGCRNGPDADG
jgi:hypothetical protein